MLMYMGYQKIGVKAKPPAASSASQSPYGPMSSTSPAAAAQTVPVVTPAQYVATYVPRIDGLPHTAPRYDEVTKPTIAPYPAACISMGDKCKCYTQQGTLLPPDKNLCTQIVANGFFQDWENSSTSNHGSSAPAPIQEPPKPWAGNPGSHPSVAVVTKGEQLATTAASDGEAMAAIRPGGYYRQQRLQ